MYEYGHEQVKLRKERWNNKWFFKYANRKLINGEKGLIPYHEGQWFPQESAGQFNKLGTNIEFFVFIVTIDFDLLKSWTEDCTIATQS